MGASLRSTSATVCSRRPAGTPSIDEHRSLAVLLAGRLTPSVWKVHPPASDPPTADLFAAKALLEALADALRVPGLAFAPAPQPFLHPGRSASVSLGDEPGQETIGWLGELHPLVAGSWELPAAACFEIDLDRLIAHAARPSYVDLIGYPPLRQDIAVVLSEQVPAGQVLAAVRTAAGKLLADVGVFDVYAGPQVGEGKRSLALALAFRAPDRTLSDEDIAPVRERIVAALAKLGGELRG